LKKLVCKVINMKRQLEENELDRVQAENERLKDKIKIYILERTYLQKRQESDESERQLAMERFKQKLAKVENEKRLLILEYQRLRRGLGQGGDLYYHPDYNYLNGKGEPKLNSMVQVPTRRVKIEPRVVFEGKVINRRGKKSREYSQEYPSPKDPGFKQELVLTALRAIGGEGTLDDVDKWVRKHHSQLYGEALNRRVLSRALSRQADSRVLDVDRRTKYRRWNIYRIPGVIPLRRVEQSKPLVRKGKSTDTAKKTSFQRVPLAMVGNHKKKTSPMWSTSLIVTPNNKQSPSASIVRRTPQSLEFTPAVMNVGIAPSVAAPSIPSEDKKSSENLPPLIAETPAQDACPLSQVA